MTNPNQNFLQIVIDESVRDLYPSGAPEYGTPDSAAFDLKLPNALHLEPGASVMVNTGLRIQPSISGFVGLVFPRSGLGTKQGIVLGNLVAVIDNDYQGEWMVCVWNRSDQAVNLKRGDKFCQVLYVQSWTMRFFETDKLTRLSDRGEGGFGSTGQ